MPDYYPPPLSEREAVIVDSILSKQCHEQKYRWLVFEDLPYTSFSVPLRFSYRMSESYCMSEKAEFELEFVKRVLAAVPENQSALGALLKEIEELRGQQAGEHAPTAFAIDQAKILIRGVEPLVHAAPAGDLDSYYGELGVEWRQGDRILRLTCFSVPDKPPRLDYGVMSLDTPGRYQSDHIATIQNLAERLNWLSHSENKGRAA